MNKNPVLGHVFKDTKKMIKKNYLLDKVRPYSSIGQNHPWVYKMKNIDWVHFLEYFMVSTLTLETNDENSSHD